MGLFSVIQYCPTRKIYWLRQISTTTSLCKKKKVASIPSVTYDAITIPGQKKDVNIPLPKSYSSKFTEAAWYDWWVEEGFFQPSNSSEKFVMLLPPPNVTGKLHIGHAFTAALQDALVRWNRMRGVSTLWIPGVDHAGIATQVVVEKKLWEDEKLTRHDVGREAFLQRVWRWKHRRADDIESQLKKMGLSLDWSRHLFTMDDKMKDAVNHAFCRLYDSGLICRKESMINWSCQLKSTIADIEVDNIKIDGPTKFSVPGYSQDISLGYLTSFAYPIAGSAKTDTDTQEIVVATTRLETLLGDTAIAVHPDDERYSHLIGRRVTHPFCNRTLPIIADEFVQPDLGTGAVKLTPAHSSIDYEIAVKHKLRRINILDEEGNMVNCGEPFDGMKRFEAREKVAQLLQKEGLWRGQVPHAMTVPFCSRTNDIIEPKLKEQWFIDCSQLALNAIQAADDKRLEFIPSYYEKTWRNFLNQTTRTPWCISRQLWWGHNIPAYRIEDVENKTHTGKWVVAPTLIEAINKAKDMLGHSNFKLIQDEDVLDTWFSAALLPFASLGWPNQTTDLLTFYPGSMIESGSDILFFWIARMVMLGEQLTGKLPFRQILIHSLMLSGGEKMSKSKGNIIDPMSVINGASSLDLENVLREGNLTGKDLTKAIIEQRKQFPSGIPECGADALRMALCSYDYKGHAMNVEVDTFISVRSLCNKIWQLFKYYQYHFPENFSPTPIHQIGKLTSLDRWVLSRCSHLVSVCEENFPTADLHVITNTLSNFFKHDISKIYLEASKPSISGENAEQRNTTLSVATEIIKASLLCLSPFMPHLAEELYQRLPATEKSASVTIAPFPSHQQWKIHRHLDLEKQFSNMLQISNFINQFKSHFSLHHQTRKVGKVYIMSPPTKAVPDKVLQHLTMLSRLGDLRINQLPEDEELVCQLDMDELACNIFVDLSANLQDIKEVDKLRRRIEKIVKDQTHFLEEIRQTDVSGFNQIEAEKHHEKVSSIKRDLSLAETCVNYLLRSL